MYTKTELSDLFAFEAEKLDKIAQENHASYLAATPFPHIVIDNFLPEDILDTILEEFPNADQIQWQQFQNVNENKLASSKELSMGQVTRFLLYQFNSSVFTDFLEKLTGIQGIIPDPYFQGGGLHQIQPGGYLKIHADFNKNKKLNLDRRLNVLLYLNKDWEESYGGHFELWNQEMTQCEKKMLPLYNRCVIFSTTDFSYHGHPNPLTCPEGRTRKSLALYYYSNGRPPEEVSGSHSTLFRERPTENLQEVKNSPKEVLKRFVPPIFIDGYNLIFNKSKSKGQ